MPNQRLTELTELTALTSDDLIYVVNDPSGTPASRKAEVGLLQSGTSGSYGPNIIKNSMGQIVIDATIPQWWLETGNATSTLEDAVGEGIPDLTEWVLKVVTISDDHHCYQVHTFADESLLDAGQTVVSFGCWVYATSANLASIAISGTNLGLQESSQHTGDSTWQWLSVNNITLDAGDTAIQTRCIVDTGTAYFTMPSLTVGPVARAWMPRGMIYTPMSSTVVLTDTGGDQAFTDLDVSGWVDPLSTMIHVYMEINEPDGATGGSALRVGHSDDLIGVEANQQLVAFLTATGAFEFDVQNSFVMCNDSQVIRWSRNEQDADNDVAVIVRVIGVWRWE
jgi:hypothetical protein